ncbi:MAG: response regulator [Candidatus Omnitrophota bacterium]
MSEKRILIIDDEESFTELLKLNLEEEGNYKVMTVNRGSEGFAAAKKFKPDLILLDMLMPDISGGEVMRKLKDDNKTKNIPVVFLTAIVNKSEVEKEDGIIGGHHFLAKPATTEELIDCIEKNINQESN